MDSTFLFPPRVLTYIPAQLIKAARTTLCRSFLLTCLFSGFIAKAQEVVWATPIGSPGQEFVYNTILDAGGNVYLYYHRFPDSFRLVKCDGATGSILYDKEFIGGYPVVDKNGDIWNYANEKIEKYSGKDLSFSGTVGNPWLSTLWRNSQGNIYSLRLPDQGTEWLLSVWNLSTMREFVMTRIDGFGSANIVNRAIDNQGRSFLHMEFRKDLIINGVENPLSPALFGSVSKAVIACKPSGEKQWHIIFYNCGKGEIQGDDRGNLYMFFHVGSTSQMATNNSPAIQIPSPSVPGNAIYIIKANGETGRIIHTELIVTREASVVFEDLQLHDGGIMSVGTKTYIPFSPTYSYTSGRIFLDPDNCGRQISMSEERDKGVLPAPLMEKGFIYQALPFPEGAEPTISHTVTTFSDSTNILLVKRKNSAPALGECSKDKIAVFPNPAHDQVTISVTNTEAPYTITFSDISGKILFQAVEQDTHRFTNIEDLAPGVYFVNVSSASGERHVRKFVKVR